MVIPNSRSDVTLLSILCGEVWWWDSDEESQIIFHENGTGLLVARREFCLFIVAELEWASRDKDLVDKTVQISDNHSSISSLGQFHIKIRLTKNRPTKFGHVDTADYLMNEALLTDEAFTPQHYFLVLERGLFTTIDDARRKNRLAPRYSYRLRFDQSPYPSREKWKDPTGAPDALKFWEWKVFHAVQTASQPRNTALSTFKSISRRLWR